MNVIVSNKQKDILDNANIDAIKDLYGLFKVEDLINNFKNYFFSKMIIDATSIVDFSNPEVLKKLVEGIGSEKIIILLPIKPVPPKSFLTLLVTLGIYNFSSDIDKIIKFVQTPNTYEDVKGLISTNTYNVNSDENLEKGISNLYIDNSIKDEKLINNEHTLNKKRIIGFKNVTLHAGSTSLIYMLKQILEKKYGQSVLSLEVDMNDFIYFRTDNMVSVTSNNLESVIKNYNSDIILIDLGISNYEQICTDVIYLVEPSVIKINKLMVHDRKSFSYLEGRKVVLNKSLLSTTDIEIFSHEAGLPIYFNIPPLNDRVSNSVLENLLLKLGLISSGSKKGIFNVFK